MGKSDAKLVERIKSEWNYPILRKCIMNIIFMPQRASSKIYRMQWLCRCDEIRAKNMLPAEFPSTPFRQMLNKRGISRIYGSVTILWRMMKALLNVDSRVWSEAYFPLRVRVKDGQHVWWLSPSLNYKNIKGLVKRRGKGGKINGCVGCEGILNPFTNIYQSGTIKAKSSISSELSASESFLRVTHTQSLKIFTRRLFQLLNFLLSRGYW